MLRISKMKSYEYYLLKEYSQNNFSDYYAGGEWVGEGAKRLGFNKLKTEACHFDNLLNGLHPVTNEKILKKTKSNSDFIDLTLSATKGYSMLAVLDEKTGYDAYINFFNRAVEDTIKFIEKDVEARVNNKNEKIGDCGLIISKVVHETSRPTTDKSGSLVRPDMNFHAHLVLFKGAVDSDKKCRVFVNKFLYQRQKVYGAYFRSRLASSLMSLGFQTELADEVITENTKKGEKKQTIKSFNVVGITNEQLAMFSKRKADIDYFEQKYGVSGSHARDLIARKHRSKKVKFDRSELFSIWKEDANLVGLNSESIQKLKTHSIDNIAKNILSNEDLVGRIFKGRAFSNTKFVEAYLCEYAQIVPIDPIKKLQDLLAIGLIKKSGYYYVNSCKPNSRKTFYARRISNKVRFVKDYLYNNHHTCFPKTVAEYHEKNRHEVRAQVTDKMLDELFNYDKNLAKFSKNKVSSFAKNIEGLLKTLGELQSKLRTGKLSKEEADEIQAQIKELEEQIKELTLQKKNQPTM